MSNQKTKFNPAKRRKARQFALQALYQWHLSQCSLAELVAQFSAEDEADQADMAYFEKIVSTVIRDQSKLDEQLAPHLSRALTELDPVELAILRVGIYELVNRPEIPYKVIINEGVELAKLFGATDGHKFVNGVLDKAAQVIRSVEIK